MRPTRAEIHLRALERNLAQLRRRAAGRRVIGIVKADAYGHGAALIAPRLQAAGCEALGVATLAEAEALRACGVTLPVLLLQGLHASCEADAVVAGSFVPLVSRADGLPALDAAARRAGRVIDVHLKFDTGMSRLGFPPDDADPLLDRLSALAGLRVAGLCSHLAEAERADAASLALQRERFAALVARVRARGLAPGWVHLDNSAGLLHGPTPGTDAVRLGVALYGVDPTEERAFPGEPVMSLWTRILEVRDVQPGVRVGYGGSWRAERKTRIATLPIGYADGLPRSAGNRLEVAVRGERVPLVGRVSMDLATLALPASGAVAAVGPGEPVLVFGGDAGSGALRVEDQAAALDTIAYELLCSVGPRVPREAV